MPTKLTESFRPTQAMIHAAGSAVVAVLAVVFYFGLFAPAIASVELKRSRMEQLHLLMASSEKVASDHRMLEERLAELRQASASTRQRMPRRHSTEDFIESITQIAASHSLEVDICSAAAPKVFPTYSQVEVSCRLKGTYASVCEFLTAVDRLSQISKVSTLTIDAVQDSNVYPIQVTFQLYYRAEHSGAEPRRGAQ